jgi:hypothetical protein
MKKMHFSYIIMLTSILLFSSCVEWGETLTFEIVNNTNHDIQCILINETNQNDTIQIGILERIKDVSSETSGNAISDPFCSYESIILIYNDSMINEYHRDSHGKNPLNLDYYKETSLKESKKQTSITYEYLIEISDF